MRIYVYIQYANLGSSAAHDARVQVLIPDEMSFLESTLALTSQTGSVLFFDLGDLLPGQSGAFRIILQAPCDIDLLGQNACVEAHIFPDSSCISSTMWSGAVLETEGHCADDVVHFTIRNTGGASTQHATYAVVRNDELLLQAPLALSPGQETAVSYPGEGAVWRVRASQEPSYPGPLHHSTAVEQCGTDSEGNTNSEFFHWFSNDNHIRFLSEVCRPYQAAYDPNDKQASPTGYGEAHIIEAGTRIDYRIRFQNTGNDTAFLVVLRDTLSPWLNPATLRPGASSHPYRVELSGRGFLKFIFDNIMLPDSAANEAASQGFVEFSILPRSDVPLGAEIFNSAAIYFDFNPPIFTNSILHTIGEFSFPTQVIDIPQDQESIRLKVLPNPAHESARFDWEAEGIQFFLLEFWNASGLRLRQYRGTDAGFNFRREGLPSGLYFYHLRLQNGKTARGKLLLR